MGSQVAPLDNRPGGEQRDQEPNHKYEAIGADRLRRLPPFRMTGKAVLALLALVGRLRDQPQPNSFLEAAPSRTVRLTLTFGASHDL